MANLIAEINATSPDMADSETESLVVHANGDANVDDLLSENEYETDIEIENIERLNTGSDSSSLKLEPRAKTRLLSRSHSVNDLNNQIDILRTDGLTAEPPRRNSSGECPPPLYDVHTPIFKPSPSILLQDLELTRCKGTQSQRSSLTPTSSMQLSPISIQYTSQIGWKNSQAAPQEKEDNFTSLLQTTAERVLSRLKSRQQDLGSNITLGQKSQRRLSHGLQPSVPRKLQPILRDGSKTPRSESDLRSINGDTDFGPLSAA